jgi:hypothetical protein
MNRNLKLYPISLPFCDERTLSEPYLAMMKILSAEKHIILQVCMRTYLQFFIIILKFRRMSIQ